MNFNFDPSILDRNELLIYSLMNGQLSWDKDIGKFMTVFNGLKVEIYGSHITKPSGGGGLMTGVDSRALEEYWRYRLLIAAKPEQHVFGGIEIKSGDISPVIDILLEDLYWFAHNQHHEQSLDNILKVINNV